MQKPELLEQIIKHAVPNLTPQEYEDLVNGILIATQPKCLFEKDSNEFKQTNDFKSHGVDWRPYPDTIPTVRCQNCKVIYRV